MSTKLGEPHSFSALTRDLSPERRERIELLPAQGFSLTQHTLAKTLDVKQAEISKIETRRHRGDLQVRAVFPRHAGAHGQREPASGPAAVAVS